MGSGPAPTAGSDAGCCPSLGVMASTSDAVVEIVLSHDDDPSRFVEPETGRMKALLEWKSLQLSRALSWVVEIDQTVWGVPPPPRPVARGNRFRYEQGDGVATPAYPEQAGSQRRGHLALEAIQPSGKGDATESAPEPR